MKFKTIIILLVLSLAAVSLSKKFLPHDHRDNHIVLPNYREFSSLNHVVRTNPSLVSQHNYGYPVLSQNHGYELFNHSTDSNAPNLGGFGRNAIIANPAIYFHNRDNMSVLHETPGIAGLRRETSHITSVNKLTGKVERHEISKEYPITGTIQKVHTLQRDTTRRLDLTNGNGGNYDHTKLDLSQASYGRIKTSITELN